MLPVIAFPTIDPVAISLGPIAIRWYALAYIAGLLLGWWAVRRMNRGPAPLLSDKDTDDFLGWMALGVVLGGRLGYVLFYQPGHYLADPLEALMIWKGGMSFHGGMLGTAAAIIWFAHAKAIPTMALADQIARVTPIGLFFGRIANFVNGELYGRVSDVSWAMVFPHGGPLPRHPSQLYQAALEGIALLIVLALAAKGSKGRVGHGFLTGLFLAGYAVARFVGEPFRQPDAFLGFLAFGTTMGQWLSLPMLLVGLGVMWVFRRP
ncbi:MAG: prolipoprotein diacylglyceryl transferase [Alphaproteobacteria bacterium]|nr:prolipoprotein diacylglyceryl transferase [Alphaproteobacteria bacterium]